MIPRELIGAGIALALAIPAWGQTAPKPAGEPKLPKVVLIGDSIRLGYAPLVSKRLSGRALVISPPANAGDSDRLLKNLDEWVIREKPAVVHFNCGLHDLKVAKKKKQHQVEVAQYRANLTAIVDRLKKETTAQLVFANTTPVLDDRHARRGAEFDHCEADVERYNAKAVEVMRAAGVPVNSPHWIVEKNGTERLLDQDGTHYTPAGYERLAKAVADSVLRRLAVARAEPRYVPPVSKPED